MFLPYCLAGVTGLGLAIYLQQARPFKFAGVVAVLTLVLLAGIGSFFHFGLHQHGRSVSFDLEHYYLGAKYYDELGYKYLYPAYACALKEQTGQDVPFIRDVSDSSRVIPTKEYPQLESEARRQFSSNRWQSFSKDVVSDTYMMAAPYHAWFGNDHGYTGSPWQTLELKVASAIPIQFRSILLGLDYLLFGVVLFLLGKTFGWLNMLAGLVLYLFFPPGEYGFSLLGFSMCRFLWLLWLVAGLAAIHKQRWITAGIFLGLASLDRLFPIFFALGAVWVVGLQCLNQSGDLVKKLSPCLKLFGGLTVSMCGGIIITEVLWPGHWSLYFTFLKNLTAVPFAPAVGWFKVVHFYPVDRFGLQVGPIIQYYDKLATGEIHQRMLWPFYVIWSVFTTGAICLLAPFRLKQLTAITLVGFFLIFQFSTLSYYYLVLFLPLVCIFQNQGWFGLRYLMVAAIIPATVLLNYSSTGIGFCFLSLFLALFFTGIGAVFIFKDHHRYMASIFLAALTVGQLWLTRHDFNIKIQLEQKYEHHLQRKENNISGVRQDNLEHQSGRFSGSPDLRQGKGVCCSGCFKQTF